MMMKTPLGDFIEDTTWLPAGDAATSESLRNATREVLAGLTAAKLRCCGCAWIDMNTDHTSREVGKQFDVTRERIRQIEDRGTAQAATRSRSEVRSFLDE